MKNYHSLEEEPKAIAEAYSRLIPRPELETESGDEVAALKQELAATKEREEKAIRILREAHKMGSSYEATEICEKIEKFLAHYEQAAHDPLQKLMSMNDGLKEEIAMAFVAKYGIEPERFEIRHTMRDGGIGWSIRRISDEELELANAAGYKYTGDVIRCQSKLNGRIKVLEEMIEAFSEKLGRE